MMLLHGLLKYYVLKQVSFRAVDDGTQLHLTGVQLLSDIYFFSQDIRVNPEVQYV